MLVLLCLRFFRFKLINETYNTEYVRVFPRRVEPSDYEVKTRSFLRALSFFSLLFRPVSLPRAFSTLMCKIHSPALEEIAKTKRFCTRDKIIPLFTANPGRYLNTAVFLAYRDTRLCNVGQRGRGELVSLGRYRRVSVTDILPLKCSFGQNGYFHQFVGSLFIWQVVAIS